MSEPFETKRLGAEADATAPDGTAVRLLPRLAGGSMAHFELPAGAVSHAVAHQTVEEIWYVLSGGGMLWRRSTGAERFEPIGPGVAVTIPLGVAFQFRAEEVRSPRLSRDHHAAVARHGRGARGRGPLDADRAGRPLIASPCAARGSQ